MKRRHALLVAALAGAVPPPLAGQETESCDPEGGWTALILEHVERYPRMELADLYKALHQATMGSEHEVSRGDAHAFLQRELETIGEGPGEEMFEPLGPDPGFFRVHLRPFLAAGGDPDRLVTAFVETANAPVPGRAELECALAVATALAATGRLGWSAESVLAYTGELAGRGFPAVHHSTAFAEAYRPAYRVVAAGLLDTLRIGPDRP